MGEAKHVHAPGLPTVVQELLCAELLVAAVTPGPHTLQFLQRL